MRRDERERLSELMARLADGDRAAFDPVFTQLWPVLRAFAVRFVGDANAGEDVAQQALLKVLARADEYEPGRDALSWALGITAWEGRSWRTRKRRSREASRDPLPEPASSGHDPERWIIEADLDRALAETLERLGPLDREVLADELRERRRRDLTPATLRKRRQRALARLRSAWRVLHGTD